MRRDCSVCLLVGDYDEAIDFYCNKLELFEVESDNDFGDGNRFVCLSFVDIRFLFAFQLCRPTRESAHLIGKQAGEHILVTFPIEDAETMLDRLARSGVEPKQVNRLPYGVQIKVKDCVGNTISMFEAFD